MINKVQTIEMEDQFRACPTCGYRDGFHSMFQRDGDLAKWFLICPSCHDVFDIGLSVPAPKKQE